MHKTNIRRVASAILNEELAVKTRHPVGFNLTTFYAKDNLFADKGSRNCGTVACIAGHAALLLTKTRSTGRMFAEGQKALSLSDEQARALFTPSLSDGIERMSAVTPKQAALVMFNLAETGKVDWKAVL